MLLNRSTILITTAVVFLLLTLVSAQRPQLIRFFPTADCRPGTGSVPFYDYSVSQNISTTQPQAFQSYCVVRGAWRVEVGFVQSRNDFNISLGDGCATCIRGANNRRYGYIQRISGADLTKASFSLFTEVDFGGREVLITGYEYSFNETYSFSSLAFTSFNNWTWQTYYSPRFRGISTCHRPNLGTEITLINPSTVNVGSIRLGCRNSGKSFRGNGGSGVVTITIIAFILSTASVIL